MAFEKKPNTGAIFKNDKREKDTQPQMKGDALIDGKEYWVSAWTNKADSGVKYQSLAFTLKEPSKSSPAGHSVNKGSQFEDMDDDVPF